MEVTVTGQALISLNHQIDNSTRARYSLMKAYDKTIKQFYLKNYRQHYCQQKHLYQSIGD